MGFFYNGGGERTALSQSIELTNRGHEVEVFAPTVEAECYPELQAKTKIEETAEIIPRRAPLRNGLGMIYSSLMIPYRRLNQFDVIVAHGQPSCWIAMKVKQRHQIPYAAYLHQVNRFFLPRSVDKETGWGVNKDLKLLELVHRGNLILKGADRCTIRSSDIVLTNSKWIGGKIKDYYDIKAHVLHPGVDTDSFVEPSNRDRSNIYMLSTNRHYPQKRLDHLIRCFKIVSRTLPNVRCVITGAHTEYTKELKRLSERLEIPEKVVFTGNLTYQDLVRTYQNAYVYTYTSPEEDFGLGPLEAASCGVPSIVWDHAGPRETVIDGETGYRVKPYDLREMARRHVKLLEDETLRDSLGRNAQRMARKMYSWRRHAAKLERILEGLV